MIFIYRLLSAVIIWPLSLLLLRHPNFKSTILNRLGFSLPSLPQEKIPIWVHAASLGEVKAIAGLVRKIKQSNPHLYIILTSMTVTGRNVAKTIEEIDIILPFPFDARWVMKRYLYRFFPKVIIIVETEIWPNLTLLANDLRIPVVFINARMTESSYKRYTMLRWMLKKILQEACVFACAEPDGQRFSRLGAGHVEVLGNIKLDSIPIADSNQNKGLLENFGIDKRPVFIAGSVREGEEESVLDAIMYAVSHMGQLYSIVVPRHPDRVEYLIKLADQKGFKWALRSKMEKDINLLIVDTVGELFTLYGLSDVAFVGGSLIDLGGQNILEPVAWGIPTIHGPYMNNFLWALEVVKGHTVVVSDALELGTAIVDILKKKQGYEDMGSKALEALRTEHGVTERYLEKLNQYLKRIYYKVIFH